MLKLDGIGLNKQRTFQSLICKQNNSFFIFWWLQSVRSHQTLPTQNNVRKWKGCLFCCSFNLKPTCCKHTAEAPAKVCKTCGLSGHLRSSSSKCPKRRKRLGEAKLKEGVAYVPTVVKVGLDTILLTKRYVLDLRDFQIHSITRSFISNHYKYA